MKNENERLRQTAPQSANEPKQAAVLSERDWPAVNAFLSQPHCCSGFECGCRGMSRLDKIIYEEMGASATPAVPSANEVAGKEKQTREGHITRVIIHQCSIPGAWYAERVGKVYKVFAIDGYGYWVRTGDFLNTSNYIKPEDATDLHLGPQPTPEPSANEVGTDALEALAKELLHAAITGWDIATPKALQEEFAAILRRHLPVNGSSEAK